MATGENQKWQESLASFVCGGKSVKDNQLTEFLATQQQQQQQQDVADWLQPRNEAAKSR